MSLMEEFKQLVISERIASTFIEGRPHSKSWGFPSFMLENPDTLETFFGPSFEPYSKMSTSEQEQARSWYETSGAVVNRMLGMIDWEDWDGRSAIDCDLLSFANNQPQIYENVIDVIVDTVFSRLDNQSKEFVRDQFKSDPKVFANEMSNNVPRLNIVGDF